MMRRPDKFQLWLLALLLTSGGLAALNFHIARSEIDLSPLATENPGSTAVSGNAPEADWAIADFPFSETLARPLFSPTRRDFVTEAVPVPAEIEVVEPLPAKPEPTRLSLQGTRSILGLRSALVSVDGQESQWTGLGDDIGGWKVVAIDENRLVVEQEMQTRVVELYLDRDN